MSKNSRNRDMITGNPASSLILFTLPMIFGNLFQQLYNIVDTIVVGRFVGDNALAAVGTSSSLTFLFIAIATGTSIGCSVVISQLYGAKQLQEMKTSISTALISIVSLAVFLSMVGLILHRPILKWMNTPDKLFEDAATYLRIYFMGLPFLFLYNISNAIFNALGESKVPLVFMIISSVINIVLDLVFVIQFGMGVAGVAYATLISLVVASVLSFAVLLKRLPHFVPKGRTKYYDVSSLMRMGKIALPSTIQQSIVSIGIVCVQSLVNTFGEVVMAGYTAATKIDNIAINPMVNIGNAVSTFTAQNIGAGKPERVKKGYRVGIAMNFVICALLLVFVIFAGERAIAIFMDKGTGTSQASIEIGARYLQVVAFFYFIMGLMNVTNGVLRGSGDVKFFMVSTLVNFFSRVAFAYILANFIGAEAIWWSIPIGWFLGLIIARLRYHSGVWKRKAVVDEARECED